MDFPLSYDECEELSHEQYFSNIDDRQSAAPPPPIPPRIYIPVVGRARNNLRHILRISFIVTCRFRVICPRTTCCFPVTIARRIVTLTIPYTRSSCWCVQLSRRCFVLIFSTHPITPSPRHDTDPPSNDISFNLALRAHLDSSSPRDSRLGPGSRL